MGKFVTDPSYRPLPDGSNWEMVGPLTYLYGDGRGIQVPHGFVTDFFSTPRATWIIVPHEMRGDDAACLHDYLYRTHLFDRKKCDWLLWDAMKSQGVPETIARIIYWNVRLFGSFAYNGQPIDKYVPGNFGKRLASGRTEDH